LENASVNSERFFINTPLAGAGLSQPVGKRAAINIAVLWTLETPKYEIYSNLRSGLVLLSDPAAFISIFSYLRVNDFAALAIFAFKQ